MNTIYKYPIVMSGMQTLSMPGWCKPLCCQLQNGQPYLWVLVDSTYPDAMQTFHVFGTGHPIPESVVTGCDYVGTFQLNGGALVLHVFHERKK